LLAEETMVVVSLAKDDEGHDPTKGARSIDKFVQQGLIETTGCKD
jgi:hypothetical protein